MLNQLNLQDLRPKLAVLNRPLSRRRRQGSITSVTLHYNGPAVPAFGNPDGELRQIIEVDVPNHQQRLKADSLMYHLVVLSDGSIWQTRDLDLQAWHCRDRDGNEHSIAVHLPLGGVQDANAVQWGATTELFTALMAEYRLPDRHAIKGHMEWSSTACPGPLLMSRLQAWRMNENANQVTGGVFRIKADVEVANVREGPGRNFRVALGGRAAMWPGDLLNADTTVMGETVGNEPRWAHRADGLGFVHFSLIDRAT